MNSCFYTYVPASFFIWENKIIIKSEEIAAITQQVSESIDQISNASDSTTQQTQQVAGLAQEQYAAIEEMTAASDFLRDLSEQLTSQISHFRLN